MTGPSVSLTPEQEAVCREWREICQTLERAQGEDLNQNCRDAFQFAKSYQAFGRDLPATITDVRQRVANGNYSFFADRGIFASCLSPSVAERMLRDWQQAVEIKKQHAAFVFHNKFGKSIDEFIGDGYQAVANTTKMAGAKSLVETDAVIMLGTLPKHPPPGPQVTHENVVEIVRAELEELSHLKSAIERLRADVDKILSRLESD